MVYNLVVNFVITFFQKHALPFYKNFELNIYFLQSMETIFYLYYRPISYIPIYFFTFHLSNYKYFWELFSNFLCQHFRPGLSLLIVLNVKCIYKDNICGERKPYEKVFAHKNLSSSFLAGVYFFSFIFFSFMYFILFHFFSIYFLLLLISLALQ